MKLKIGDCVQLKSYHTLKGIITWIDPECDSEGRVVHVVRDQKTYRLNESSIEFVFPGKG